MTTSRRLLLILAFLAAAIVVVALPIGLVGGWQLGYLVVKALLVGALLLLLLWLLGRLVRWLLWRVGRRLAFSYFLIGVLPIPMVIALVLLNAYLIAGYFLGHLYRDAMSGLNADLAAAAESRLEAFAGGRRELGSAGGDLAHAYYRRGQKVAGDERFPRSWPEWMGAGGSADATYRGYVALADGTPTLAAVAEGGERGVITLFAASIEEELTRRADVWVALFSAEDPQQDSRVALNILGREFALKPLAARRSSEARDQFFRLPEAPPPAAAAAGAPPSSGVPAETPKPPMLDRPLLWWGEISGSLLALEDGATVSDTVTSSLNGTIRTVFRHLLSGTAEVDTMVWASLISITGLLATIYGIAAVLALVIIYTLSRAVNRLSRATDAVRGGDFSVRIPVRRRDQLGQLQRSFNQMAVNLERLVATASQKEILENELQIARDLQQSLIPSDLPASDGLDFATFFEPSAAIGGDYFDILRFDDRRLAVIVADVSGHGLPTGLRMAMLKAALVILVEEAKEPQQILRRLSEMIQASGEKRFFVTATLATVDFSRGEVDMTNAGHPPVYVVRDEGVEEVLLPGNPLGALGYDYGRSSFELRPGDVVVWLSDGLIEAADPAGDPFGYERVRAALDGPAPTAAVVRDRLLEAVSTHAAGRPVEDDRTLVVMRYSAADGADGSPS